MEVECCSKIQKRVKGMNPSAEEGRNITIRILKINQRVVLAFKTDIFEIKILVIENLFSC